jgi:uncharacterized membrane protein YfcA
LLLAIGAFAGILSGLLGVGGGIVIVPFLFHLFTGYGVPAGLAMPLAVGTSLSTIVLTSLVSARNHHAKGGVDADLVKAWMLPVLSTGYVNWVAFAVLVPMTMWMAPLGVRLAYALNVSQLKRVFAVFLCLVGLKMAWG